MCWKGIQKIWHPGWRSDLTDTILSPIPNGFGLKYHILKYYIKKNCIVKVHRRGRRRTRDSNSSHWTLILWYSKYPYHVPLVGPNFERISWCVTGQLTIKPCNHLKHGPTGLWRHHQQHKQVKSSNKDWLTANIFNIQIHICNNILKTQIHSIIKNDDRNLKTLPLNMTLTKLTNSIIP